MQGGTSGDGEAGELIGVCGVGAVKCPRAKIARQQPIGAKPGRIACFFA
jgi:hypothetical protein